MPTIIVTGGAGYIGSHTTLALCEQGYDVVVLDNLSTGVAHAVLPPARLVECELTNADQVRKAFQGLDVTGVIHFAASIVVPESVENPLKYYDNNLITTSNLLAAAGEFGVKHFLFSSSAAVYGIPTEFPVKEGITKDPINPYGRTKLINEWMIEDMALALTMESSPYTHPGMTFANLRYFNVAGCDIQGRLGQNSPQATHLIKVACQAAVGTRDKLMVFGDDYDTHDGSGVRDYIHVSDLADVHVAGLQYLERGGESGVFNCGYGHGYSVLDVANKLKEVSGVDFNVEIGPRRAGDPGALVADVSRMNESFGWKPKHDDLAVILKSALDWEKKLSGK
ncbi:MAG: UDP-glucose 4-epimerase GalE [Okeania sp. SIO3B3]|nr:UDP-glucose 4-epimerase GalE [Okeania sp. SIO3B3]